MPLKKFLLAGFVVISFALYSFHGRHGDSPPVVAPSTQAPNTANTVPNSNSGSSSSSSMQPMGMMGLRDGQYTGDAADAFYGLVQVKATVSGGKITDVQFLQYPNDRSNSIFINKQAMPYLKQEAVTAQSSQVDIISGATDTSMAFIQSLASALSQAKI